MQVVVKPASELTEQEVKQCKSLSMRSYGMMSTSLTSRAHSATVVLVRDGERLIGWCLGWPADPMNPPRAYFYVRKTHRRRGIGTILMNEITKHYGRRPYVYPHDTRSARFFKNFDSIESSQDLNLWSDNV
jgi:GNAT superfamily N-acetyltransferase